MSQIEVTNLTFSYEGSVDPVFEKLTLTLDTDWRLGLIGKNGAGKTTFLNLLAGLAGKMWVSPNGRTHF